MWCFFQRSPRLAVVLLLVLLACLAVTLRPLSSYVRRSQTQVLDLATISSRDSQDRVVLGSDHPVNQREQRPWHNGRWTAFGASFPYEAFMYSAFYDDRPSLGTLPVVRVIAVMEDTGSLEMLCALYYRATNRVQYVKVFKTDIGAGVHRHSKVFTEFILVCALYHEEIPDKVGLVTQPGAQPEEMIPVEIPERPPQQFNFGLCMSVSYWKQDPHHIVEWLEMLRILGVNGVTVYNNSLEQDAADVFLEYAKEGFVDFRQSHNFMDDEGELTIHMHMSPVINDCMYRSMFKYKWIIVTDWDELIIPRTVNTYHEMIEQINKFQVPQNKFSGKHYLFRNGYFFIDIPGLDESQPNLVTLQHRKRIPVSERGYSVKSIIDPLSCTNMHNHYCWRRTDIYAVTDILIEVEPEYGVNQHYKRCHFDEFDNKIGECKRLFKEAIQDDIMLRYKEQLIKLVNAKLVILGLKPL